MIDPLVSLAFSLQANRGAYALLVGSGISRAAGIPTGWEITLELVRKLAATSCAELDVSAEAWFRETYGREPDYSELLDQLCKSAPERQQYLKGFFEPTDSEREEGAKAPTAAHHAIAELMAEGYVRVIITTNFDRLLEQALEARGVVPVVVSNTDQIKGMIPLVHQKHCIVKVHGDYLDTRMMNTEAELAQYTPEMDRLLDQVFDEFGLILCGWSGAWDPALRNAISRAPSRRFSSYWVVKEELGDEGQKLVEGRGIVSIPIETADDFFTKLSENLASLREYDRPHPLSVQSAVASVKRYLAEDRYRIRLHDLLMAVVHEVQQKWKSSGIELNPALANDATLSERIKSYDTSMELLLPMGKELGKWARPDQFPMIFEFLQELLGGVVFQNGDAALWQQLSRYPATQLLYAIGISAIKADNLELVGRILTTPLRSGNGEVNPAVALLFPMCLGIRKEQFSELYGGRERYTPLSDWLEAKMKEVFSPTSDGDRYNDPFKSIFDEFELMGALAYRALTRDQRETIWAPVGCWAWRSSDGGEIIQRLKDDLDTHSARSRIMRLGIFRSGDAEADTVISEVAKFSKELRFYG